MAWHGLPSTATINEGRGPAPLALDRARQDHQVAAAFEPCSKRPSICHPRPPLYHLCTSQQESLENLDESLEKPSWQLLTHSSVDQDSSKGGFNQRQLSNTMH
jgi:hypothetical protein